MHLFKEWEEQVRRSVTKEKSSLVIRGRILTYRNSTHIYTHTQHTHTHTHTHTLSLSLSLSLSHTHTHFNFQRQHSLFISTSRNSLTLSVSKRQFNTRNMGAYTFCNLFLSCSAFSVKLVPASNTASEISSIPERDKQPAWEKTHSSKNTLLYFRILIPRMKYLVNIHFIVYRTPNI